MAGWLTGGPPEYYMYRGEGNALVDDFVCKAHTVPFEQRWSYIEMKLERVELAGHTPNAAIPWCWTKYGRS